MAAITSAVVVAGSTAYAANRASKASKEQGRAASQANDVQERIFQQQREDQEPWRQAGVGALNRISAASTGDLSSFYKDPSYEFTRTEGMRGLERSAAAAGGAFSGNALRALAEFNGNNASSQFGDWWNRQAGLAGVGQTANAANASAGQNYADQFGRNTLAAGDARASGIVNQANVIGQGLNALGGIAGYYSNKGPRPGYGGTGYGSAPYRTPGYGDGVRYG